MKTSTLRNAALAALVTTASAASAFAADLTPFARVEATYTDSGYDGGLFPGGYEAGVALTAGVFLAPQHEVSITSGYTKWDSRIGGGPVPVIATDLEHIPVLLNYRFHFSPVENLTVYLGPTAGLVHETATAKVGAGGPIPGLKPAGSYEDSAWKTAFGGTIGISYSFAEGWEVNAAAQILRLNGKSYDLAGTTSSANFDSATRVGFSLGLTHRW